MLVGHHTEFIFLVLGEISLFLRPEQKKALRRINGQGFMESLYVSTLISYFPAGFWSYSFILLPLVLLSYRVCWH